MQYRVKFLDSVDEVFFPGLEADSNDLLEVFSFSMTHEEGQKPVATIEIANPGVAELFTWSKPDVGIYAYYLDAWREVFQGTIISIPTSLSGDFVNIEIVGGGSNLDAKMRQAARDYFQNTSYKIDDLFIDIDEDPPEDLLRAEAAHFHVSRRYPSVSISQDIADNVFNSTVSGTEILDDSLEIRVGALPPSKLTLPLEAEWIDRKYGRVNIANTVNYMWGGQSAGIVTFTPDTVEQALHSIAGSFGATEGYTVVGYDIKRSLFSGIAGTKTYDMKTKAEPLDTWPNTPNSQSAFAQVQAERVGFQNFTIDYNYEQPRREEVRIEVTCNHAGIFGSSQEEETLDYLTARDVTVNYDRPVWSRGEYYDEGDIVRLGNRLYRCIGPHTAFWEPSSFGGEVYWEPEPEGSLAIFQGDTSLVKTLRGKRMIEYGLACAEAEMKRRSRFIEVTFRTLLETALEFDISGSINLQNYKLPGGQVYGKIVSLKFFDNGTDNYAEVTIAATMTDPSSHVAVESEGEYMVADYVDTGYQNLSVEADVTIDGVSYNIQSEPISAGIGFTTPALPAQLIESATLISGSYSEQRKGLTRDTLLSKFPDIVPAYVRASVPVLEQRTISGGAGGTYNQTTGVAQITAIDKGAFLEQLAENMADTMAAMPATEIELKMKDLVVDAVHEVHHVVSADIDVPSGITL